MITTSPLKKETTFEKGNFTFEKGDDLKSSSYTPLNAI